MTSKTHNSKNYDFIYMGPIKNEYSVKYMSYLGYFLSTANYEYPTIKIHQCDLLFIEFE